MEGLTRNEAELEIVETAERVLPAGGFGNVGSDIVIAKGRAGRVWDESGNEYVDYLIGSGPMLIGHAHPEVTAAAVEQLPLGTTYFVNNRHGIKLAEEIVSAVACAEKVRFVSSGSEADLYAMRVARAYTGREKILKFEGGYHGMSDYGLMSLAPKRPGNFPQPVPDSAGIPRSVRDEVLVAPYNDIENVESLIREHGSDIAGVIIEPFQRIIPPEPGFLEAVRKLTADNDIVLIFDEVVTGFRLAYGGAQAYYGVTPDICTLGKAIGGGFPLAAIAGRDDIMAHFDSARVSGDKFLMQVGTLSGNPIAAAAGLATLQVLKRPGAYDQLFATGTKLMEALSALLKENDIAGQVIGVPPLFDVVFTDEPIRDYRDFLKGDAAKAKRLNALLLERGILKGDGKYYVSMAHTADDVQQTIEAWTSALKRL